VISLSVEMEVPARSALLCLLPLLQFSDGQFVPEERCPIGDTDQLSGCLASNLNKLRPFFRTGIPEQGIPPGDPLVLDQLEFNRDGVVAKYSNVVVRGFSEFQLNSLRVSPADRTVRFDLRVPEVRMSGDYDVAGSFLILRVTSNGNFSSQLRDVDVKGTGDLVVLQSGLQGRALSPGRVQMTNLRVRLEIGETQHQIDYSKDTNPIIGETVRRLVTRNDRILLEEVRPEIEAKVAELMARLVNRVLAIIPVQALGEDPALPQASRVSQVSLPAPFQQRG